MGILLAFIIIGAWRGFMRGILRFVTSTLGLIMSVFIARPIATVLDRWFGFSSSFSRMFTNEGAFYEIVRNTGFFFLVVVVAFTLFASVRIAAWLMSKKIKLITRSSKRIRRADRQLGALLGVFKFIIWVFLTSVLLMMLDSVSFTSSIPNAILGDSTIASWMYDLSLRILSPFMRTLSAAARL